MLKGLFADSSPLTMLVMLVFTMLVCFLLFMFTGMLLAPFLFGISVDEIAAGHDADNRLNAMRYMQILYHVSVFIVPAFIAAYLFLGSAKRPNVIGYFELERTISIRWFIATLLLMFAVIPFINLLAAFNEMIVFPESLARLEQWFKNSEESARQSTKLLLIVDNAGGVFFNIFMIAMLPAIGEELIFRGVLHNIFVKRTGNVHVAIIITGFLFSAMHLQFYGLFPRWLLGVMFGYLLVWSGSIWAPIFAHFVNNAVIVCISFLTNKEIISEEIKTFGANWADIFVTILATSVCAGLLWIMYRKSKIYITEDKNNI